MYINNLTCVRINGGEIECFRINSGMKMWMGRKEESGDCLASNMQMTWFRVVSREKSLGTW